MKRTKTTLLKSAIALLLCVSMLVGSTFAWFTDSVGTSQSIITSGNLDIEMYWTDDLSSNVWHNVEDAAYNTIFNYDNWEPGYTDVKYIKLVNKGELALNYNLTLTPQGRVGKLAEVINVFFADSAVELQSREDLSKLNAIGLLNNVMNGGATASGTLLAADQYSPLHPSGEVIMTMAMNMIPTAGNDYQLQKSGDFTITALATQAPYEQDSFGADYDSGAEMPVILTPGRISIPVTPVEGKVPVGGVTMAGDGISAFVPENTVMAAGADRLTLTVTPMENTTSDITAVNDEILIPVDVHIEGISADNTVPVVVDLGQVLPKYLNMGNYHLYHVENGAPVAMTLVNSAAELTQHNRFTYDSNTGAVSVAMATFSEVALLADQSNPWSGDYEAMDTDFRGTGSNEDPYLISNADELAGLSALISENSGNYNTANYKLISDININGEIWYPIGYLKDGSVATFSNNDNLEQIYFAPINPAAPGSKDGDVVATIAENSWYTYGGSFRGTFDGNGNTVSGIYQNTWAMRGNYDGHYYNAAMGLFGYVNGGTVKNLTIDNFNSEGEFAPTGCVTAYAAGKATFENISITGSHPQTYNTGVAGIVGWDNGGDTENEASDFTFKNITIDSTNTISALWGSWDVAAAGLMGYLGKYSKANLVDCNIAATIDVNNDVCGNYQYYWYRYCGAFIGTVDKTDATGKLDLSNITATDCTVNFGDRHNYYYCEFEKNTQASYTEDFQFSRVPHEELNLDAAPVTCKHEHTANEDKQAVYIPFRQLFGGYGWGVDGVDIGEYENIKISDLSESVEKFEAMTSNATYSTGTTVTIGELFKQKAGTNVNAKKLQVFVSPANEESTVSATYVRNETNWTEGTLTFSGKGQAKIVITDYDYCLEATMNVTIEQLQKFEVTDTTAEAGQPVRLGELFAAENVDSANVTVTVTGGEYEYVADEENWEDRTLTFKNAASYTVTITDGDLCIPTENTVTVSKIANAFRVVLPNTANYLYRVGNQNEIPLNALFAVASENAARSVAGKNFGDITVTVKDQNGEELKKITITDNTFDTAKMQIEKYTGPVVVTVESPYVQDVLTLNLEVINATNVAENGKISNRSTSSVLLGNTSVSTLYLNGGATLYGNGFTIDCTNSPINGSGNVSENYIIGLVDAHLDNVKIVGKVYTEYGAQASNNYNRALVISRGTSTITNCYLSNTAAPVRINDGNLTIKGSTLKGGNFANIDIRSGHLTLDNVTTINQALSNDKADNGTEVIGLGIVVYYEMVNTSATSITVKNGLTQYNHISSNDKFSNTYANQFVNGMFDSSNSALQYANGGTTWVNTGIILMTTGINVTGAGEKADVSFMGATGAAYTVVPTAGSIAQTPAEYAALGQGLIAPSASLDHDNEAKGNYIEKEAEKNDYCYFDGSKVLISMDQGDTFQYDPFILNATKLGQALNYTVKLNGNAVEKGSKIAFNTAGEYTITYTYEDPYNYRINKNGTLESFSATYVKTDVVSVAIVEPQAAHATFTFATNKTATEEILYNNNTYISAKGVTANGTSWGKITVGDKTIVYPIVTANVNRNTTNKECQVFYYVFKNVISIADPNGTNYDAKTGTDGKMPSNLKVIKGNELKVENNVFTNYNDANLSRTGGKIFCYSSSSQEDAPEAFNGALAYKSPSGLGYSSSTRNYDAAVIVQYQFTDSNNATYYYYVGYKISNPNNGKSGDGEDTSCITPDTLITLADGTQKRVDSLTGDEMLLVWNLETGKYEAAPIVFVDNEQESEYTIIHLYFSDGSDVKVISEHGFFDMDLGKYVYIDANNYADYVGHRFVSENDITNNNWDVVTLDKVVIETEVTTAWSPVTFEHLCYYTNGVLSMPGGIEGLFNIFEVDTDTMTYDAEQMQKDIETYGLLTLEDFGGLITRDAFDAFNGDWLMVAIGKGLLTWEDIAYMAERYIPLM